MGELVSQREQQTVEQIVQLHQELVDHFQKSALIVFRLGRLLTEVKAELNHGDFLPWVEQSLPFGDRTARKYMRVYEHFKGIKEKQIAEMAATEAFYAAGIRKMIAATPQESKKPKASLLEGLKFTLKANAKTFSGLPLKHTRLGWEDKTLYVDRTGRGPGPAILLYIVPHMDQHPSVYEELKKNLCIAFEIYYSSVEEAERKGEITYPQTRDMLHILGKRESREDRAIKALNQKAVMSTTASLKAAKAAGGKK